MLSKKTFANLNRKSRRKKVGMILSIIKSVLDKNEKCSRLKILNIGTGAGVLEMMFSEAFPYSEVYGVDVADERIEKKGYKFIKVKDERLPFQSNYFDIVTSNSVMEHVSLPNRHIEEIYRVLKRTGLAYLAVPNKFWIFEHHFGVPFLSFFPKKVSNAFCRVIFKRDFNLNLYSYSRFRNLLGRNFPRVTDFTPILLKEPKKYLVDIFPAAHIITSCTPKNILKFFSYITPAFIFILKKT